MTDFFYAGRRFTREVLDEIWDFGQEVDCAWDWLLMLGYGESGLNEHARHDGGLGGGVFGVYTKVHGGQPEDWMGVEGTRRSMREMWYADGRWAREWRRFGGWSGWLGSAQLPDENALPSVIDGGRVLPADPRAEPRYGRTAYLYHAWPRYQGSIRPTWERALQVEAYASLLAVAYAETRGGTLPPPEPPPCPPLDADWTLAIGIAQIAVDGALDGPAKAHKIRALLDSVSARS
jgi:hypothetical protein